MSKFWKMVREVTIEYFAPVVWIWVRLRGK